MTGIKESLARLNDRIAMASKESRRDSKKVMVLAVSKKHSISSIEKAFNNGLMDFGENYVGEGIQKIKDTSCSVKWHFIGKIQSNKTRDISKYFDWVQTVDRVKIAKRLSDQRPDNLGPLQVLIQVQADPDDQHGGVPPQGLEDLARVIAKLPNLSLRGLMCIPEASKDKIVQRKTYHLMATIFDELKKEYPAIDTLSMGMSNDLEAAIIEGSTMVRIGTALFGTRN